LFKLPQQSLGALGALGAFRAAVCVAVVATCLACRPAAERRPDVIVYLVDTLRAGKKPVATSSISQVPLGSELEKQLRALGYLR
jgi:hypothetical protein